MSEDSIVHQEDEECWKMFQEQVKAEQAKWWAERTPKLKKDVKREEKGLWYLGLSIISLIGGLAGVVYGLAGEPWIQKPYVIMGGVMILLGLSVVIGGFGRVSK